MELNGKKISVRSIVIEGINRRDYPDFSDAYISQAKYTDGTYLTEDELNALQEQEAEFVQSYCVENAM